MRDGMAAIFQPRANIAVKAVLLGLALLFADSMTWWWGYPRTDCARRSATRSTSRSRLAIASCRRLGIQRLQCHSSVEVSAKAGMPPWWRRCAQV